MVRGDKVIRVPEKSVVSVKSPKEIAPSILFELEGLCESVPRRAHLDEALATLEATLWREHVDSIPGEVLVLVLDLHLVGGT